MSKFSGHQFSGKIFWLTDGGGIARRKGVCTAYSCNEIENFIAPYNKFNCWCVVLMSAPRCSWLAAAWRKRVSVRALRKRVSCVRAAARCMEREREISKNI